MKWRRTPDGVIVPDLGGLLVGEFGISVNRGPVRRQRNLVTDEGINFLVDTYGLDPTPPSAPDFFIAPYGDDVSPDAGWTAASFTADSGEITGSTPEGYIEATRQQWLLLPLGDGVYDNYTTVYTPATFHLRTASLLQVCGFGVLTDDTKGGTSGVLLSAIRLSDAPANYDDRDILDITYRLAVMPLP